LRLLNYISTGRTQQQIPLLRQCPSLFATLHELPLSKGNFMKSLFIGGLIVFVGSLILIYFNYEKFDVDRNGVIVKMRLEKIPTSCLGAKLRYFVSFSYKGEMYDKATRGDFCDKHHVGEMIDIKWLNGSKYILWPSESGIMNLLSYLFLGIVGLIISALQWKKMRRLNQL